MTTQTEAGAEKSFVNARLPWIVAALAAVVYLLTLNPWFSLKGMDFLARATDQRWVPGNTLPVFNLVTSPIQWFPVTWVPAALNVFSASCAVVVLGLLARCVALMPQDRTYKQRERERNPFGLLSIPTAWIPPVLAVLICGLQLTFWENATNSSSNIFDLVLFAYSVRCLLEYRISFRESWLWRATVVYAAGMADTWVLVALSPVFLIALAWIRGFGFFQLRFLTRLFLCALAGLSFYLYLPLANLRTGANFWTVLQGNVQPQFQSVIGVYHRLPHDIQFYLTLTSLLPILVIGIRWKSNFGDSSHLGTVLTTWIFHLTHAVLLGVCIWAAFDTGFSLRDAEGKLPFLDYHRDRMLPLYYLGALSIGYLSGYFLLVFRPLAQRSHRGGDSSALAKVLNGAAVAVISVLLFIAPLGLLYKNLPQIKTTNGPALRQYAAALTENLPSSAVLLSDHGDTLLLARAWLAHTGKASDYIFLDTHALRYPAYHRFEQAKHPDIWPPLTKDMYRNDFYFRDQALIDLLVRLGAKRPIYYLHPSFGAFFEVFYVVPHGLVYEMKQYETNTVISAPRMPETVFAENEAFWKEHESEFGQLLQYINPPGPGTPMTFRKGWMQRMHIPFEKNQTAGEVGYIYSLALNTLGDYDQRIDRLDAAGNHFTDAGKFSPDNVVATANLDFNRKLRAGEHIVADSPESFEEHFGKFETWEEILNANGLFDTATGCLAQGIVFARGSLFRQGAQQFERVLDLAPDNLLARLWLAGSYIHSRTPEKALPLIAELNARADGWRDLSITPGDVLRLELAADYANKRNQDIQSRLKALSDTNLLGVAAQLCMSFKDYTNALLAVDRQLESNPDDVSSLVNQGILHQHMGNFGQAITNLTRAISLQSTNSIARLVRAASYLESGRFDEAQVDYQILEKTDPNILQVNLGLGELALQKKDTNKAVYYLEICLTNFPPKSVQGKLLAERIKSLKSGSP